MLKRRLLHASEEDDVGLESEEVGAASGRTTALIWVKDGLNVVGYRKMRDPKASRTVETMLEAEPDAL